MRRPAGNAPITAIATALALLAGGCTASSASTAPPAPPATAGIPGSDSQTAARRVLATKLDVPWDMAVLPDFSVLITLRDRAEVVRVVPGGEPQLVSRIPDVVPAGEGGLLGVALSPDYDTDHHVFLYFTAAQDNRVVRYDHSQNGLTNPVPIITGIPKAGNHNGGRLRFGPDGNLYIGTGDAGSTTNSQDLGSLGGKILRVLPDGGIPGDNPFATSAVYSYGHRNVQGLGWDGAGQLYASEFGQNRFDELNLIRPGGNYGWPQAEGVTDDAGLVSPLLVWQPSDASPSGIAVTPQATVYIACLRGERVWRTSLTGTTMTDPRVVVDGLGRIRHVEVVGEELYVLTNNTARGTPGPDDDQLVAIRRG